MEKPGGNEDRLIHELQVHQVELKAQNEELRRAQLELEKIRDNYSDLYDFAPVSYFTLTDRGMIKGANLTAAALLGVERGHLIGKPLTRFITRDNHDIYYRFLVNLLENGDPRTVELKLVNKSGKEFDTRHDCIVVEGEEKNSKFIRMTVTDIRERKAAEKKLKEYAETQETLVKEVNHRVRNNLAVLVSMMRIEKEKAETENMSDYLPLLDKLIGTIKGLSTAHNMLSSSGWAPLKLKTLCEQVIKSTVSGAPDPRMADFRVFPSDVEIDGARAHHLALVINELTFNSIKHASHDMDRCRITVEIEEQGEKISIRFKDNGAGYPAAIINKEFRHGTSGLELITGIVTQSLAGEIHFSNQNDPNGAVTTMSF